MADIIMTYDLLENLDGIISLKDTNIRAFSDYILYFNAACQSQNQEEFLSILQDEGNFNVSDITSRDNEIIYFLTLNDVILIQDKRVINIWFLHVKKNSRVWPDSLFIIGTGIPSFFPKKLIFISQNVYKFTDENCLKKLNKDFEGHNYFDHGKHFGIEFFSIPKGRLNIKSEQNFFNWLLSQNRRKTLINDLTDRFNFADHLEQKDLEDFLWVLPDQLKSLGIPSNYIDVIVSTKDNTALLDLLSKININEKIKNFLLTIFQRKRNYLRPVVQEPRDLLGHLPTDANNYQEKMFAFFNEEYLCQLGLKPNIATKLFELYIGNDSIFEDELLSKIIEKESYIVKDINDKHLDSKYELAFYAAQFSRLSISEELKMCLVASQSISELLNEVDILNIGEKDIDQINRLYIDYNKAYLEHTYREEQNPFRPKYENHLGQNAFDILSNVKQNNPNQYKIVTQMGATPDIVRGCAGSGKTLTGILKACFLAQEGIKRILFLVYDEFIREEIEYRFQQLQVGWALEGDNPIIEIKTLYNWCMDLQDLKDHSNIIIDELGLENSILRKYYIRLAIQRVKERFPIYSKKLDNLIEKRGIEMIDEEISVFIKGRMAYDDIGLYLSMERSGVGHGKALKRDTRHAIWEVFKAYEEILQDKQKLDKDDIFISTYKKLTDPVELRFRLEAKKYDYIIIDEAQDLFPLHIRLISHMVKDESNILVLLDPTQTIYAREKVSLADLLRQDQDKVNEQSLRYSQRCTKEILSAAWSIFPLGYTETDIVKPDFVRARSGKKPIFAGFRDDDSQFKFIKSELNKVDGSKSVALICLKEHVLNKLMSSLKHDDIVFNCLNSKIGSNVDVIFGHMVKGRQYDYVFVVGLDEQSLPLSSSPWDTRLDKERKRIYTMFTRTKEMLFVTWRGRPHPLLPSWTNSFVHGTIANWS